MPETTEKKQLEQISRSMQSRIMMTLHEQKLAIKGPKAARNRMRLLGQGAPTTEKRSSQSALPRRLALALPASHSGW